MNDVIQKISEFITVNDWLIEIYIILFLTLILSLALASFLQRLLPKLKKTTHVWDDTLVSAIYNPLLFFLWAFMVTIIIPIVLTHRQFGSELIKYIVILREILFIIFLFWFSMLYVRNVERRIFHQITIGERVRDRTTVRAVSQLLRIVIIIIAFLLILQSMNIQVTSLLAVGGIGGLAFGFAAKDTLSNFIGGLMIFWDRPFSVGDWIRLPDQQVEGIVENIGWRLTKIRTLDKRLLYVPNGTFSTVAIENPSAMSHRRINATIGIRYQDAPKIKGILKDIENMLRHHPGIDTHQVLQVYLSEFGPSSLNFIIYAFTQIIDSTSFYLFQQEIFLKVIDIIIQHGAECAFPSTTLYVPDPVTIKSLGEERHVR